MEIKSENNTSSNNSNTLSSQSIWLYEETLTLIDFVRSKAFLYDRKDPDYNKNQKKNAAWEKVSEILQNKYPKECKRKWSTLRIQQRRILLQNIARKRKSVHWQFYEPLQFLISHMEVVTTNNDTSTKSNYSDDSEADETESTSGMEMENDRKSFIPCHQMSSNNVETATPSFQDSGEMILSTYPHQDNEQQQHNFITSDQSDNVVSKSVVISRADTISHSHENRQCHMHKGDTNSFPLNYFLMDVQLQMGKLNDIAQMELKIEIQKLILEKLRQTENLRND